LTEHFYKHKYEDRNSIAEEYQNNEIRELSSTEFLDDSLDYINKYDIIEAKKEYNRTKKNYEKFQMVSIY
jgi:hypothetical protein